MAQNPSWSRDSRPNTGRDVGLGGACPRQNAVSVCGNIENRKTPPEDQVALTCPGAGMGDTGRVADALPMLLSWSLILAQLKRRGIHVIYGPTWDSDHSLVRPFREIPFLVVERRISE